MLLIVDDEIKKISYKDMKEKEIIEKANNGDSLALEFLINKYKNLVRSKSKIYYIIGGDKEDIIQEGMIGLYKAIKDYDASRLSSFAYFADTCITRQIITAIKTAGRQKHQPLNSYISLNKPIYEGQSERTLMETVCCIENEDPEHLIISRECLGLIEKKIERILSDLEKEVLMSYADGMTYQEIADQLNRQVKSIDNALQRVKKKMELFSIEDSDLKS